MSLSDLLNSKTKQGDPPQGGSLVTSQDSKITTQFKDKIAKTVVAKPIKHAHLLYSIRPNLAFWINSRQRIQFKGNYLETDDSNLKDFALTHYGNYVSEVEQEEPAIKA